MHYDKLTLQSAVIVRVWLFLYLLSIFFCNMHVPWWIEILFVCLDEYLLYCKLVQYFTVCCGGSRFSLNKAINSLVLLLFEFCLPHPKESYFWILYLLPLGQGHMIAWLQWTDTIRLNLCRKLTCLGLTDKYHKNRRKHLLIMFFVG